MCDRCGDTGWVCANCGTQWEKYNGTTCCDSGVPCECNPDATYEFEHIFASTDENDDITRFH